MESRLAPSRKLTRVVAPLLAALVLSFGGGATGLAQKNCPCSPSSPGHRPGMYGLEARVTPSYQRQPSKEALRWADEQLKAMTLEEKAGQLISVGVNARFLNQESEEFKELRRQVERNHVGGIILFRGSVYESVHLVNRMQRLAKVPLLISADLEAGSGMRFDDTTNLPWNMAVGATGDPAFARRQGELTAREARALGIQQVFAPVADVNNNAGNPVINVRSFGEDPSAVARFVAAFIEGAQSAGVIATAKHFPGHGDTETDSHRGLPVIDVARQRLDAVELVPFRAAVRAGVGSVMMAHIGLPQIDPTPLKPLPAADILHPEYTPAGEAVIVEQAVVPGTLSPVITNLLRQDLDFDGIVVTDALDMSGLTIYVKQEEAGVRAVLAGADMLLKPADPDAMLRGLVEAVKGGRLSEQRIQQSARKLLATKYDLGLADKRIAPLELLDTAVASPDALKLADEVAARAVTLVRDDARLIQRAEGFGLKPGTRVFNLGITNGEDRNWVAGPFISELTRLGVSFETTVLDSRSTEQEVNAALERAQRADIVIASMYGRVRSGAANSVGLPAQGARVLRALIEKKAPVIGVSFGNPYLLQSFPGLGTYVVAYGDMPSLQRAAARSILGSADFSGRLPISLPGLYPRGTGIQLKAAAAPPAAPVSSK